MRTVTISKRFTFDAAHQLPNHDGKCRRPHGHTYTVVVFVTGLPKPINGDADEGMVLDFSAIKFAWKGALEPLLDHRDLNQTIGPTIGPTTAENIASWLLGEFQTLLFLDPTRDHLDRGLHVSAVQVWETPTSCAEARPMPSEVVRHLNSQRERGPSREA